MMIKTQAMIKKFSISNSKGELNENFELQVSRDRLAIIQEKVYNCYYVLNTLRIKFIHRLEALSFLSDTLPLYPEIMICRLN